jgi:hypothetical protein
MVTLIVLGGIVYFAMMVFNSILLIKRWVKNDSTTAWSYSNDMMTRFMTFVGAMLLSVIWPFLIIFLVVESLVYKDIAKRKKEERQRLTRKNQEILDVADKLKEWLPLTKSTDPTEKEIAKNMVATLKARQDELS